MSNVVVERYFGAPCALILLAYVQQILSSSSLGEFARAQQTLSSSPGEFAQQTLSSSSLGEFAHGPHRPSPQTLPGCPPGSVFLCAARLLRDVQSVLLLGQPAFTRPACCRVRLRRASTKNRHSRDWFGTATCPASPSTHALAVTAWFHVDINT
jgi:hypothetical protein